MLDITFCIFFGFELLLRLAGPLGNGFGARVAWPKCFLPTNRLTIAWSHFAGLLFPSPELAFLLFWSSLCFPLARQKIYLFAGILIPAKVPTTIVATMVSHFVLPHGFGLMPKGSLIVSLVGFVWCFWLFRFAEVREPVPHHVGLRLEPAGSAEDIFFFGSTAGRSPPQVVTPHPGFQF